MEIRREHMEALMRPSGVVIVGATDRDGSVGKDILNNIISGRWVSPLPKLSPPACGASAQFPNLHYGVFPVNPKRQSIYGFKCYPAVHAIDVAEKPNLAIICVPAAACPAVIRSCGELGTIRAVVVIAAGFKEVGAEGRELELECVRIAQAHNIGLVGPNCLGIQSPNFRLNASFSGACATPGHIAFISQSGAICTAVLDWSLGNSTQTASHIGFSAFVSLGSMAHVEWADWIRYYGEDTETDAIVMYMESVGNASEFLNVAQAVAKSKPIVVIKAGKSDEASAAAVSHTGSLTGTYDNFLAAMERAGCLVVDTIDDFQNIIDLLSTMSLMQRDRGLRAVPQTSENIVIVTNAGGPGVLCTDAVSAAGLKMISPLPADCVREMSSFLPAAWSHANPADILGDADAVCFKKSLSCLLKHLPRKESSQAVDATLLVVLSPQSVTEPLATAEAVAEICSTSPYKPLLICSWMGGATVEPGRLHLREKHIPVFSQPDVAARMLGLLARQQRLAKQSQAISSAAPNPEGRRLLRDICNSAAAAAPSSDAKTFTLSEHDSKAILETYGIDVTRSVKCLVAADVAGAVKAVGGFPVVMKIHGGKFSHKSDIGGVMLNIETVAAAESAFARIKANYEKLDPSGFEGVTVQPMIGEGASCGVRKQPNSPELLIGSVNDPQFGPMVMFGAGGTYVEVFNDTAITLAPIDKAQAAVLVGQTQISKALIPDDRLGKRFAQVDPVRIYDSVAKFSRLCADLKDLVVEGEMNPLIITDDSRMVALDARLVIRKDALLAEN